MYRGLATRHHQAADWLGLGRGGFCPASSATSNAEYGGWFSQDSFTRPALPRTRSEATSWRNASVDVPPNVETTGLVQLLRETESNVRSNSLKPAINTKAGSYPGSVHGAADLAYNIASSKTSVQADGKILEIYDGKSSGLDFPKRPHPNQPSVSFGGRSSFADQFSGSEARTRDAAQHSYALQTQLIRGQLESDLQQLRKSSTTLDLLSDRAEKTGRPTTIPSYAKHAGNASEHMPRSILGKVPLWRNHLSQDRLVSSDSSNKQGRPLMNEGACALSSVSSSGDLAPNRWERRVTHGEATTTTSKILSRDEALANGVLTDRFRDDRLSNCEKIGPKLEPIMMQADTQPGLTRQKQSLYQIPGDEGKQKLGRYDGPTFIELNSVNCTAAGPSRFALEADNFPLNGARTAQPAISSPPQLEIQHRIDACSDLTASPTTAGLNDARYSIVSDFAAVPKKSILKKPRVYSSDVENAVYSRRMDMSDIRRSSGPASCFNQRDNQSGSLGDKLQEHHQKRVTFRLDQ